MKRAVFWLVAFGLAASAAGADATDCLVQPFASAAITDVTRALEAAGERDQAHRKQLQPAYGQPPMPAADRTQLLDAIRRIDLDNLALLDSIVCRHGWPDRDKVGERAAMAAFLIVQHADQAAQERYLPALQSALKTKQVRPDLVATLEDRINVRRKRPQRYGSQLCYLKSGGYAWQPIENENEEALDALREAVGLEPIKRYAARFGVEYTPPSKRPCD